MVGEGPGCEVTLHLRSELGARGCVHRDDYWHYKASPPGDILSVGALPRERWGSGFTFVKDMPASGVPAVPATWQDEC